MGANISAPSYINNSIQNQRVNFGSKKLENIERLSSYHNRNLTSSKAIILHSSIFPHASTISVGSLSSCELQILRDDESVQVSQCITAYQKDPTILFAHINHTDYCVNLIFVCVDFWNDETKKKMARLDYPKVAARDLLKPLLNEF